MRRRGDQLRARRPLATLVAGAAVLVACTGGGSDPAETVATTTTEVTPERIDDGVLIIGALIPSAETGIDTALRSSFERSIEAINEAGGVLGNDVEFVIEDEGQSGATASQAIENLVEMDVDAILGPTSSRVALEALDVAVANGIVSCSPTATSIALDAFPDNGLFFRSIATDSLQAIAIAGQATETGAGSVVIVHVDDAYGRPYSDAVADALGDDIAVQTIPIAVGDDDLTDELDRLAEIAPQVVVSVGSGEDTASLLQAMGQRDDLERAHDHRQRRSAQRGESTGDRGPPLDDPQPRPRRRPADRAAQRGRSGRQRTVRPPGDRLREPARALCPAGQLGLADGDGRADVVGVRWWADLS